MLAAFLVVERRVRELVLPPTTWRNRPLVSGVAQVVLKKIADPTFLAHVREVGDYFDEALHDLAAKHLPEVEEQGAEQSEQRRRLQ